MQQDNDLKYTGKSTSEWLEWPCQSPDLNLAEILWSFDLKQTIHARKPPGVTELKQLCKEEWTNEPVL